MNLEELKKHPLFAGVLPTKQSINMLGNKPIKGEMFYITNENKLYIFNGEELIDSQSELVKGNIELSVYDMNKQLIEQQGPIKREEIKTKVYDFILKYQNMNNNIKYFLAYGKEISYFTLFIKDFPSEFSNLAEAFMECLKNLGTIYDISLTEDDSALEIWVKISGFGMTVIYLFPYDEGICTFGG